MNKQEIKFVIKITIQQPYTYAEKEHLQIPHSVGHS